MYKSKYVMNVVVNGTIQKELENGCVPIPFGCEYKIRLRNKHNRRAVCKLYIDGENVSGGGFIIGANSFIEIERPVETDKKFKFVSLDSEEAYDYGKNGPNYDKKKGTIVAEFALEKEYKLPEYVYIPTPWYPPYTPRPYVPYEPWVKYGTSSINHVSGGGFSYSSLNSGGTRGSCLGAVSNNMVQASNSLKKDSSGHVSLDCLSDCLSSPTYGEIPAAAMMMSCSMNAAPLQDGATVEGSKSYQNFSTQYFNNEDEWTSVRLFLQGYDPCANQVLIPVTTIPAWRKLKESDLPKPFEKDEELLSLEARLNELRKAKARKEIEELEAELA